MKNISFFVVLAIFFSSVSHAELYKWVDENGKAHFSDKTPSTVPENKVQTVELPPINTMVEETPPPKEEKKNETPPDTGNKSKNKKPGEWKDNSTPSPETGLY